MLRNRDWSAQSKLAFKKVQDDDLVMGLVEVTLAQPKDERERYLRSACGEDSNLFSEVWKYVEWEERMDGFLLEPLYAPPSEDPFRPSELLDDRFRIVREVAHGGMGIVYEAVDEKLGRRIAIKSAKAGFHRWLPAEVLHASEIAHPNVCRIFEIHTATTDHGEIDFLTMEFLDGETLAERLQRGPVLPKEARAIAEQLCGGLAEAHRMGVVHRDLKSSNVILTSDSDGTVRAVITDFGLARGHEANLGTFQSGALRGTPDYLAPELWKGEKPSVASDIYALGVILYELASGEKPFASLPELTLEERMTRRPPVLRHPWRRIVERCLEPDPVRRFASVSAIGSEIAPPRVLRHWAMTAAIGLLASVIGIISYSHIWAPAENLRLAILPFEASAADRPLSDGLLDNTAEQLRHITTKNARKLTVIPWADAVRNKADTLETAAGLLGATHTLTGTIHREGERTTIHAYLTDARSRLPLKEWQAEYRPDSLRGMPLALAGMVTGTLNLSPVSAVATVNSAAYPDFIRGVGLLERNTVDEALPFLEKAVTADSDSPLTFARLAEAQHLKYEFVKDLRSSGGDDWLQLAKASLAQAELRNPDLAVVREVSGMINKYAGAYERAEEDYQRALQIEPLNGDVWRRLGDLYQDVSKFPQAVAAYQKAVDIQPGYFKNYEALCTLYMDQANHDEAIRQCQIMVSLVPQLSESHFALSRPYLAAGRYVEAEQELRIAVNLDPQSSKALHTLGISLLYQKRYLEAIAYFRRALQVGPENELLYLNLGTTSQLANLPQAAEEAYRKALTIAEAELARNPRERTVRSHLAYLCAQLGQRSRAEFEAAQALQLAPSSVEVARMIVLTYEALGERDRALALAGTLPDEILRRLTRSPYLADLPKDPRFQQLLMTRHIK